jgi:hypothetical protein
MKKILFVVLILSIFCLVGCVKISQLPAPNLNQAPKPETLPALNQPTTNNEQVPIAPKEVFDNSSLYVGQKFRFQGCLEPHKCDMLPDLCNVATGCVKQECDIDHLANCCDCIKNFERCPFVDLQQVPKEKLAEIRKTNATKYNVEVVGTVVISSKMRPIQIEAMDFKILGECQPQK